MGVTDDLLSGCVSPGDLRPDQLFGRYRIVREIGVGGMGTVYQAVDEGLGRTVALKVITLPRDEELRGTALARFHREARTGAGVHHPGVVTVFGYEVIDERPVLIMEYVEGHTLRQEIDHCRALRPEVAVRHMIGVLDALAAIHAQGVVHRDLKPQNVMLNAIGAVKVCDLGIAKALPGQSADLTLTRPDDMQPGTPLYMSPEQINARPEARTVDHRSDLYAIGVMLHHLMTGEPPFQGSFPEVIDGHRFHEAPEIVSPFGPIPPGLQAVVRKAMQKDPAERFQSATEMRAALLKIQRVSQRPVRWHQLHAALPVALVCLLVGAVGLLAMQAPSRPHSNAAEQTEVAQTEGPSLAKEEPARPTPAPTTADGCKAYEQGQLSRAIDLLETVLAKTPDDAAARYCLCAAEVPLKKPSARQDCEAWIKHPGKDAKKLRLVQGWLKRI